MPNVLGGKSMYQRLLGSTNKEIDMPWLCSQGIPEEEDEGKNNGGGNPVKGQWLRKSRQKASRSKAATWGPTHSLSSDEADDSPAKSGTFSGEEKKSENHDVNTRFNTPPSKPTVGNNSNNNSQDTASTKSSHESTPPTFEGRVEPMVTMQSTLGRVWDNLQCLEDTTTKSTKDDEDDNKVMDLFQSVCSPCRPKNLGDTFSVNCEDTPLGIARLAPPNKCIGPSTNRNSHGSDVVDRDHSDEKSTNTVETAADRRRQRHKRRQNGNPGKNRTGGEDASPQEAYEVTPDQVMAVQKGHKNSSQVTQRSLPVKSLELNCEQAVELERCISELTMRSSYGEATAKIAESRRMAYYAVGRHHRQSGRGGNRRCYFTGKLILGGAPFYAGSVQQGLRTLVVFCLPSAVGLPKEVQGHGSSSSRAPTIASLGSGRRSNLSNRHDGNASVTHSLGVNGNSRSIAGASLLSRKNSKGSRLSSMDDATSLGCSVEEELDPNWELDREYLLRVLPEPKQDVLDEMAIRYPTQFETLPVQVRSPPCWNLYVKFCFFSGLPIAEGEMHYKVRESIADRYGEEINLSHEVMEAVNGDSAEILRLPNLKTFRYLRKHYHQQSAKLPDSCFQRQAWEMVRPEV
mmetsp:Transcript_5047/g.12045  ORF Transcript_5047/g.12045 Transcript_5047/m.12045 type:complete len:629 (+) Transcript_5047:191-2077(+)|eukprot:CAMPEP_0116095366 /NCGR_PEP_ID=MMETSP0327-20121206/9623_1 /TAXON_ID=44447 /ORGANISM="Pseudo-nitzschia delicatissima, Strain B596" /LENGTH=628 /DNA_ID=CAMNT_0003587025 /DNA_START=96 /DNA_END=1982 /DNA_ORIENTATION=-